MSGPPDAPTTARRRPWYSTTVGDMLLSGFLPAATGEKSQLSPQGTLHDSTIVLGIPPRTWGFRYTRIHSIGDGRNIQRICEPSG